MTKIIENISKNPWRHGAGDGGGNIDEEMAKKRKREKKYNGRYSEGGFLSVFHATSPSVARAGGGAGRAGGRAGGRAAAGGGGRITYFPNRKSTSRLTSPARLGRSTT